MNTSGTGLNYNPGISAKKGITGARDGVLIGAITTIVVWQVRSRIITTPEVEMALVILVGAMVTGSLTALERLAGNWWKHRRD